MKKILPLLAIALLATATVSAQGPRYGVTGALNVPSFSMSSGGVSIDTDSRLAFNAGFKMDLALPIMEGFYMDAGVLLSAKGSKYTSLVEDESVNNTVRPYYLEIPLHFGYRYEIGEGMKRFDFGLGLRGGVELFDHYQVFLGYDWGLVDASNVTGIKIHNRNFYIGAAYLF